MNKYAKAIVGSLIAGLGSVDMALGDNVLTAREVVKAVIVVLTTLYVVYLVPNAQQPSPPNPPIEPVPVQPSPLVLPEVTQ